MPNESIAIHNVLSSAPKAANKAQWHLTLQQIGLMQLVAGISGKTFAMRLRDLSAEEVRQKNEKYRRDIENMLFAGRSFHLGASISHVRKQIELALETNKKLLDDLESKPDKDKHKDRIQQLKNDRETLEAYLEQVDEIDDQRMNSSSIRELSVVEKFFEKFTKRYRAFIERIKKRRKSSKFNSESSESAGLEDTIVFKPKSELFEATAANEPVFGEKQSNKGKKRDAHKDGDDEKPKTEPD